MRIRIKGFDLSVTYPALCLFSFLIIARSNYLYCLISVILHETAHLLAMVFLKAEVSGFYISMFDIKITARSRHKLDYKRDIIIIAAGPSMNLLLFLLFYNIDIRFAFTNLFVGLFNLLPAASLDGGQLMYLALTKHLSHEKAAFIIDILTLAVSIPLFILGILVLLNSIYNFSLLFISLYLVLSLFIKEDKYL